MESDENKLMQSPLFDSVRNYLVNNDSKTDTHYLYVPYIKTAVLEKLIEGIQNKIVIVTTWRPLDLLNGSSDLGVYPLCKERGIALYINNQIHLKIYSSDLKDMILATANISNRGLGTSEEYNLECATHIQDLTDMDRDMLVKIRQEATHIDDEIYQEFEDWYNKQEKPKPLDVNFDEIIKIKHDEQHDRQFLISALPMTKSIKLLEESYEKLNKNIEIDDIETRNCVLHDLTNYYIPRGLSSEEFRRQLQSAFFDHPFIQKIDEFISPEAHFGQIKQWIQNNCTTVPVPSRRELTGNVQVLLEWFAELGDGKYVVDVPGARSQRIRKMI